MIRYSLLCGNEHAFESWFRDSAAFDALAAAHQVACPACGSLDVRKAVMAPSVVSRKARPAVAEAEAAGPGTPPPAPDPGPPELLDDGVRRRRTMIRDLHRHLASHAENVGRGFASEARAIHDGEAPARAIYGEASRDEVEGLLESGVPLLPIPALPDEHN